MTYPPLLIPSALESITMEDGRSIPVPKATPHFNKWMGAPLKDSKGGKPVLDYRGQPLFAELLIVRLFEESGWKAVWVDNYQGRHFRTSYWPPNVVELPMEQKNKIGKIDRKAGTKGGAWDVFGWKGKQILFAEAKWRDGGDRIGDNQKRWLAAAIDCGRQPESFLLVEWCLEQTR